MVIQAIIDREKGIYIAIAGPPGGPFEVRAWGPDKFSGLVLELDEPHPSLETLDEARKYAEDRYSIRHEQWRHSDVIGSALTHRDVFRQLYPKGLTFNELCAVGWIGYNYEFLDNEGFHIPISREERGPVYPTYRTIEDHMEFLDPEGEAISLFLKKDYPYVDYYALFCKIHARWREVEESEGFKRLFKEFIAGARVSRYWSLGRG